MNPLQPSSNVTHTRFSVTNIRYIVSNGVFFDGIATSSFFENASGPGKLDPGGPICTVQGIKVPCFIRWGPNGSIASTILKEALEELDNLGVLPRVNGVKPYILVDGHGSRFGLNFLSCINDPAHEWVVCIGTPYGIKF